MTLICMHALGGACTNGNCSQGGCLMNTNIEVLIWSPEQPYHDGDSIAEQDARSLADGARFFWEDGRLLWRGPAYECRDDPSLFKTPEYTQFAADNWPKSSETRTSPLPPIQYEPATHFGEPLFYTIQGFDPLWDDLRILGIYSLKTDAEKAMDGLRDMRVREGNRLGSFNALAGAVVPMTFQRLCYQLAQFYLTYVLPLSPSTAVTITTQKYTNKPENRKVPAHVAVDRELLETAVRQFTQSIVDRFSEHESLRGPHTWQENKPEYAATLKALEDLLR